MHHTFNARTVRRGISRVGILAAFTGAVALATGNAHGGTAFAAVGPCRSDPIVVLSNLKVMDLTATIQDSSSDLNSVTYTMHLPAGVKPLLVIGTDGLVGQVEHFVSYSDQPAGQYVITTFASTGAQVSVTATTTGVLARSGSATGSSNQNVTVVL